MRLFSLILIKEEGNLVHRTRIAEEAKLASENIPATAISLPIYRDEWSVGVGAVVIILYLHGA